MYTTDLSINYLIDRSVVYIWAKLHLFVLLLYEYKHQIWSTLSLVSSMENKHPIKSQDILHITNERTEILRISKIKKLSRCCVKLKSVHWGYQYLWIEIICTKHKSSRLSSANILSSCIIINYNFRFHRFFSFKNGIFEIP